MAFTTSQLEPWNYGTIIAHMKLPRILIVDHFDSYTLNILSLLAQIAKDPAELDEKVVVLAHTHPLLATQETFKECLLPHFEAIILSPGPGTPEKRSDFGFGLDYLRNASEFRLPTLGVCLGHQGLAVAFGGSVKRAVSIQHGSQSKLQFPEEALEGGGIFLHVPAGSKVTRYNSLTVNYEDLPPCLEVTAFADDIPNEVPTPMSSALAESAEMPTVHRGRKERCILGLAHKELPLWGVQFHPESIESPDGIHMLRNFITLTERWLQEHTLSTANPIDTIPSSVKIEGQRFVAAIRSRKSETDAKTQASRSTQHRWVLFEHTFPQAGLTDRSDVENLHHRIFQQGPGKATVWLDSARAGDPQSNFSYMAQPAFVLTHHQKGIHPSETMLYISSDSSWSTLSSLEMPCFWSLLDSLQESLQRQTFQSAPISGVNRFRGGFVGYMGYEMKRSSQDLRIEETISYTGKSHLPEAEFAFCPAVLQLDHKTGLWSASLLIRQDTLPRQEHAHLEKLEERLRAHNEQIGLTSDQAKEWISTVETELGRLASLQTPALPPPQNIRTLLPTLRPLDNRETYKAKVEGARALISRGESYELCLTTQFIGQLPAASISTGHQGSHFELYRALRARNPAPYAAYLQLPNLPGCSSGPGTGRSILSTSPERFLSKTASGLVEMKPIKGTVPRAGYGPGEAAQLAAAGPDWASALDAKRRKALEADPKERAENLMIVDLIRADLLSYCYPHTVAVPLLMKVETYESVHQLVTTVRGQAKPGVGPVQALKRCFPPGSMTGAPKRRSVTLLEQLEGKSRTPVSGSDSVWSLRHRPRGPYSGSLGWIGLDGAADFSVVIRTAVIDDDTVSIGAGGAITYLSDAEKEWQEVLQKVQALAHVDVGEQ